MSHSVTITRTTTTTSGSALFLFYFLISVACLIGTFCLLTACLVSLSTASLISKTVYEVIYHGLAFILYLAAGLTLLIEVNHRKSSYRSQNYEPFLAASMLGGLCQSLLVKYGMSEAGTLGSAFHGFLTTASACLLTTALLIACYECLFNAVACFLYLSASSYMGVAVNLYLYPQYAVISMYSAYPAMTAVYIVPTQEATPVTEC
ncbi:hypothetical protein MSG28_003465 [Choristoneura fumiferana]|uniref:Uncharacterized protein n=1 Tax=Choristoneura fumiferana TaxID=7141 RepID=A0ACC0KF44_CHOFU|nr:hypothetical protein MSG28_003465 [Choristoneura fumiferana]